MFLIEELNYETDRLPSIFFYFPLWFKIGRFMTFHIVMVQFLAFLNMFNTLKMSNSFCQIRVIKSYCHFPTSSTAPNNLNA